MSILKDLRQAIRGLGSLAPPEGRQNLENPSTPISSNAATTHFVGTPSSTGVTVNEDRAMGIASIFAGIRVITESVASLPLETYRRTGKEARERDRDHPAYQLLKTRPNRFMSSFNYWELALKQLVFRGNHYAEIEFDNNGDVAALWPLVPEHTRPWLAENGQLFYATRVNGFTLALPDSRVLHISALGNGIEGRGILDYAKETLGYAAALDEFQGRFFSNGAHPSGFLKYNGNGRLSDEAKNRIASAWKMAHGGLSNAHRTAVFEENLEWTKTSVNPDEAQAIEARKLTRSELAGILRVPAHFINDLERATFSNIEHLSLDFVIHSLRPWLVRIEQELNYKLFKAEPDVFCEFNVDGLLRGDKKSRAEALEIERRNGVITPNEWRRIENKNPIDNDYGESYLVPLNNAMVSESGEFVPIQNEDPGSRAHVLEPVIRDAFERVARREARGIRKILKQTEAQDRHGLYEELDRFYNDMEWVHAVLDPAQRAGAALGVTINPETYIERSKHAVFEDAARADAHAAIESRVSQWEEHRAADETRRAFEEVSHAVSE